MRKAANKTAGKDGFLFLGNEVVLDFLNTRPVQDGEPIELFKDFGAVLRWFRAAGLLNSKQAAYLGRKWAGTTIAQKATEAVKDFRERLRQEILAWEQAGIIHRSMINELNRLLRAHPTLTRLRTNGTAYSTELWFEVREPTDLFAPLARSAAILFAAGDRGRVRKCGTCVLHFRDTSKKGTRRWCSMRLCGNRFKVRAYSARHRQGR